MAFTTDYGFVLRVFKGRTELQEMYDLTSHLEKRATETALKSLSSMVDK
jgi:hypothetical protein